MDKIYLYGIFFLFIGICIFIASCNKPEREDKPNYTPIIKTDLSPDETELLRLFNQHRDSLGLHHLIPEVLACKICYEALLEDKEQGEYANHDGWSNRIKATNGEGSEIVAANYLTPQSMFNGYMNSPKHKSAIESSTATHIGLAIFEMDNYCLIINY